MINSASCCVKVALFFWHAIVRYRLIMMPNQEMMSAFPFLKKMVITAATRELQICRKQYLYTLCCVIIQIEEHPSWLSASDLLSSDILINCRYQGAIMVDSEWSSPLCRLQHFLSSNAIKIDFTSLWFLWRRYSTDRLTALIAVCLWGCADSSHKSSSQSVSQHKLQMVLFPFP